MHLRHAFIPSGALPLTRTPFLHSAPLSSRPSLSHRFAHKHRLTPRLHARRRALPTAVAAAAAAAAAAAPAEYLPPPTRPATVKRLLNLTRAHAPRIAVGILFAALSSAILLVTPAALGRVLDAVGATGVARARLGREACFLLVLYVLGAAAKFLEVLYLRTAGERIVHALRRRVFARFVGMDVADAEAVSGGDVVSRLGSDVAEMGKAVSVDLPQVIIGALESIAGFTVLFLICPPLFPFALASVPLTAGASIYYGKRTAVFAKDLSASLARSADVASEFFGGLRVVKAFTRERLAGRRYDGAVNDVLASGEQVAVADAVLQSYQRLVFTVKTVIILWLGGRYVSMGILSVGGLLSFAIYTSNIAAALGKAATGWGSLMRGSGAVSRVMDVLEKKPGIETGADSPGDEEFVGGKATELTADGSSGAQVAHSAASIVKGEIEFKNVTFSYPTRLDEKALDDVSFALQAGSSVAICGGSGGGKSSLIAILERFYDPASGSVLIDGKPLREYELSSVRGSVMGLVPQEPVMFSGSIKENISFGYPGASELQIEDAARAAGVLEFTKSLPEGLETRVGPGAGALSGGEKQRVMIARCLVKNPRILLLDEATSSLDAASEAMVNATIEKLMAESGRTIVLISHRLSIAKGCDSILVMDKGCVRQQGTHAELIREGGLYSELLAVSESRKQPSNEVHLKA